MGKFEIRGGKVEKNRRYHAEPILAHPVQKSCRRPCIDLYKWLALLLLYRESCDDFIFVCIGASAFMHC